MKFGIFDHLDDSGLPLPAHYEGRLQLAELYDRAGFHCYHVAEHHGTPLGHAPSPGVLLAALSQRTRRLHFGPLVYLLPFYHPLRLIEEIGMLSALSGGRYEFGFGRGVSPIEQGFYGVTARDQAERYAETLEIVMQGLASDRLTFHGRFHQFDDVPLPQRPARLPPLWYGSTNVESATRAGREGWNFVTLLAGKPVAAMLDGFNAGHAASGRDASPLFGVGRHVVVAESAEQALALARPAFARWRASFVQLWEERGATNPLVAHFPKDFDSYAAAGMAVAGTPKQVRAFIAADRAASPYSYFVAQFAFGDLPLAAARRSVELFADEVMPAFAGE